jgi:hypothetical protein
MCAVIYRPMRLNYRFSKLAVVRSLHEKLLGTFKLQNIYLTNGIIRIAMI